LNIHIGGRGSNFGLGCDKSVVLIADINNLEDHAASIIRLKVKEAPAFATSVSAFKITLCHSAGTI
jgi:hypothetical protein